MEQHQRGRGQRERPDRADARARRVQRAGQAAVEERSRAGEHRASARRRDRGGHRQRRTSRCERHREAIGERRRVERLRRRLDAGGVGAGDDPRGRRFGVARRRDQSRAGRRACEPPHPVRSATQASPRSRQSARRRRSNAGPVRSGARPDRRAAHSTARPARAAFRAHRRGPIAASAAGTPSARSRAMTVLTGLAGYGGAFDAHGQPLAPDPVQERLGVGADDRRHVVGLAPVVQIPPDVIAGMHVRRGRALGRLHAVDVVEPVARLDRPRRRRRRRRCSPRTRRRSGSLTLALRISRLITVSWPCTRGALHECTGPGAEVARDRQRDRARRRSRAEAAARRARRRAEPPPPQPTPRALAVLPDMRWS